MYRFYLWLELSDSPRDGEFGEIERKLEPLKARFTADFGWAMQSAHDPIVITNGFVTMNTSLATNHRSTTHSDLLEFLEWVGRELPGSYGLVYWTDDEDASAAGSFRVIRMARGELQHRDDPFLSPLRPVVED